MPQNVNGVTFIFELTPLNIPHVTLYNIYTFSHHEGD